MALIANTPAELIRAVETSVRGGPPLHARLELAREHTYERRTARMLQFLEAR